MVEIVFKSKTDESKAVLKLDSTNSKQETCTISQVFSDNDEFNANKPFVAGQVVTVGEIKKYANDNSSKFDAYAFDGDKGGVSLTDYYEKETEEEGSGEDVSEG